MTKTICAFTLLVTLGSGLVGSALLHADTPTTRPTTNPAVDPKPINKKCPMSGDDVDLSITSVYNGKTYAFCCADCKKAFDKDPAKYAPKAH